MRSIHSPWLVLGLTLVGLCGSLQAQEKCDFISDQANPRLFSKEGVEKACQKIEKIKKDHQFDLFVTTVQELPETERKKFPAWRWVTRRSFFSAWAEDQAREKKVDGVFVLICNNPKDITVIAWPRERQEYFGYRDREQLKQKFNDVYRKEGPNQAQLALIERLEEILTRKGPPGKAARPDWLILLILIGSLLGFWIVLSVVGYFSRRRSANARVLDQTPALLGGMFGNVASFPIYDRLLHRPIPPEATAPATPDSTQVAPEGLASRDAIGTEPLAGRRDDSITE